MTNRADIISAIEKMDDKQLAHLIFHGMPSDTLPWCRMYNAPTEGCSSIDIDDCKKCCENWLSKEKEN